MRVASTPALAQGFYYKEIAKDGRIYVFNVAANADRFEKSGEMGVGITKLGAARTAKRSPATTSGRCSSIFFKHGISEPVADPPAPAPPAPPTSSAA